MEVNNQAGLSTSSYCNDLKLAICLSLLHVLVSSLLYQGFESLVDIYDTVHDFVLASPSVLKMRLQIQLTIRVRLHLNLPGI